MDAAERARSFMALKNPAFDILTGTAPEKFRREAIERMIRKCEESARCSKDGREIVSVDPKCVCYKLESES